MGKRKRITIKDVAKVSGFSTQTVSRVVNDHPDVAPDTRKKVQRAIENLGYRPSSIARSLIKRNTQVIGVVASGHEYYGPSGMAIVGIERQLNDLGYYLTLQLLNSPESDQVEEIIDSLIAQDVEGIIWAIPEIERNRDWWLRNSSQIRVPVVLLSMHSAPGLPIVSIDNRSGARQVTEHLLEVGRQKIGFISGPTNWWEVRERRLGWEDTLSTNGLKPTVRQIAEGDWGWGPEGGVKGLKVLLEQFPEIDAVFACNDHIALGVLKAANDMGLMVPGDLAVAGFDNRPEAAYFHPPLTTVHQQLDMAGALAARELIRIVSRKGEEFHTSSDSALLLRPKVIIRESTLSKP